MRTFEDARDEDAAALTHTGLGELAPDYAIAWHAHLLYLAAALHASPLGMERFWEVHERVSRAHAAG